MLSRFSHVQLFATLWTLARQAPLSMEFSRQEYWSRQSLVSPRDLPNPGIEPGSPALQVEGSDDGEHNLAVKYFKNNFIYDLFISGCARSFCCVGLSLIASSRFIFFFF